MTTGYNTNLFVILRKYSVAILAFLFVFGLHSGVIISANSASSVALMRRVVLSPVSIVGSICLSLVPFIFSAICVQLHVDYIIPLLACIKGFLFGFVSGSVYVAFGTAGWLVRFLFQFCSQLNLILLLLFWLRFMNSNDKSNVMPMLPYYTGVICLCLLDYFCFAPFLRSVL